MGTTSVKALAVDENGQVVARSRVAHSVVAPEPDILRHDAKRAWRSGPRKAFEQVTEQLQAEGNSLAGVAVASMVPSLTAVNRQGVPVLPGLLYGDREGRAAERRGRRRRPVAGDDGRRRGLPPLGLHRGARRPRLLALPGRGDPRHLGHGRPIDTGVTASLGMLHTHGRWNAELLELHGRGGEADADGGAHGPGRRDAARERRRRSRAGRSMPSATRSCRALSTRATSW